MYLPDMKPGLWVKPERGLIEEKDPGVVKQAARDLQPPLHAARILLNDHVGFIREFNELEDVADSLSDFISGTL